jgi:hypothetical protein
MLVTRRFQLIIHNCLLIQCRKITKERTEYKITQLWKPFFNVLMESANHHDVMYQCRFMCSTKWHNKRVILVPLFQAMSVAGSEMERAVIRSLNVAFDDYPLPCMGIIPSVKGQC